MRSPIARTGSRARKTRAPSSSRHFDFLAFDPEAGHDLDPEKGVAAEGAAARRFEEVGGAEGVEGVDRA